MRSPLSLSLLVAMGRHAVVSSCHNAQSRLMRAPRTTLAHLSASACRCRSRRAFEITAGRRFESVSPTRRRSSVQAMTIFYVLVGNKFSFQHRPLHQMLELFGAAVVELDIVFLHEAVASVRQHGRMRDLADR